MQTRNRGWIWYFVVLVILGGVTTTALILFNLSQQLKPEELAKARRLWSTKGMHSYRLIYTVKNGEATPEMFVAHVRHGKTEFATMNGQKLPDRLLVYRNMDALLDDVERFLSVDRQEGKPRTYLHAVFDTKDGHLVKFVRRVMGSRERVEINVQELTPLTTRP